MQRLRVRARRHASGNSIDEPALNSVVAMVIAVYNDAVGIHSNGLPIATEKALLALRGKEAGSAAAGAAAASATG